MLLLSHFALGGVGLSFASLLIIKAKPPIKKALYSASVAFSNHTSTIPRAISINPMVVVFGLRKILSIILNISVPTP